MGEGVRVIGCGNGVGVDVARSIWVGEGCSSPGLFRCVLASLYECLSVRPSVRRSVGPSVGDAFVKNEEYQYF